MADGSDIVPNNKISQATGLAEGPLPVTRRRPFGTQAFRTLRRVWAWEVGKTPPKDPFEKGTRNITTSGTQITTSTGHPFRRSKRKGMTDIGGDFFTQKSYVMPFTEIDLSVLYYDSLQGGTTRSVYTGPLLAVDPSTVAFPPASISSNSQLDVAGTKAIASVKPNNPVAGLVADLAELFHGGLPHLIGSSVWEQKMSAIRSAGDEYLNYQFGYKPLAEDIGQFADTVTRANAVIKQYQNGIGKPTKRRYDFQIDDVVSTSIVSSSAGPWPIGSDSLYFCRSGHGTSRQGVVVKERRISQQRWFKGAFTYFMPDHGLGKYDILVRRLGLELTPESIWEATPWTWAVDWFSDAGDVISNYSSFHRDGLVMSYGYIMEHTIVTDTYKLVGCRLNDGSPAPVQDVVVVTETKQRRGATPYGFGLNFGALSGFQKSIIGALGMTKLFR